MSLMNTPPGVDTYVLPADSSAASAAVLLLLNGAATKIRMGMYSITEPHIIAALIDAHGRGVDVKLVLDWSQAHMHWESMAIHILRQTLTPARVVYTTSTQKHLPMHLKIATIDDTTTIDGSTNWTNEGVWGESNQLTIVTEATLATMNSATIDALAAYGLAHLPQT